MSIRYSARKAFYLLASSGHPTVLLMHPWQEYFYVSSSRFNKICLTFITDWLACVVIIFVLPPGDAYSFVINMVRSIFISQLTTHHLSTSTAHISRRRLQRCYFVWHNLPLPMALRRMAIGEHPRAIDSRLFRSNKCFPRCLSFCAPARRSPAICALALLVACRSCVGHF